jgi:epoxide hydrolase 4
MGNLKCDIRFSRMPANGIHLHVAEAGPSDGPLLILLHGFPEFWYSWRHQIGPLAQHGFHVVVPDQRGYNLSDKPKGAGSYDIDQLAADVIGIADHLGHKTFDIAGHDWGAAVGWWLAGQSAGRVRRLVALNAPHPAVWMEAIHNNPAQRRKSWYVRFFQMPFLPEFLIGLDRSRALAKGFHDARPGAFTEADLEEYRTAWSRPGVLTATIDYYRAMLKKPLLAAAQYRIDVPTLVIWGKRDAYALPELAEESMRLCTDGRIVYLDGASHWVQHDEPERVLELLLDFFRL